MLTQHQSEVYQCALELQKVLPALVDRHEPLIVIAALTEHVRGAMVLTREARACAPQKAKEIARRVQEIAFAP